MRVCSLDLNLAGCWTGRGKAGFQRHGALVLRRCVRLAARRVVGGGLVGGGLASACSEPLVSSLWHHRSEGWRLLRLCGYVRNPEQRTGDGSQGQMPERLSISLCASLPRCTACMSPVVLERGRHLEP